MFWHNVKRYALKLFGGLFMELKDGEWTVSKGAVAFWVLFVHCLTVWQQVTPDLAHKDVSDGELYTLWALLGYAGVKIGASAVSTFSAPKGAEAAPDAIPIPGHILDQFEAKK